MLNQIASVIGGSIKLSRGAGVDLQDLIWNPSNPLQGALSRADPLFNYTWYVDLPGPSLGVGTPVANATSSLGDTLSGMAANVAERAVSTITGLPWNYVEEATLPMREYDSRRIFRNGKYNTYPSKYTVNPLSMVIYGDADGRALRYLSAWHSSTMHRFGRVDAHTAGGIWQPPSYHKRSMSIVIMGPDRSKVAVFTYTGCWIAQFSPIPLGSSGSERTVYNVTLSVDDVFINVLGLQGLIDELGGGRI